MENANEGRGTERRGFGHDNTVVGLDRRRPLMRVDLTVNIPTILTILAMITTVSGFGITLYSGLEKRQMTVEFEVAKLNQRLDKNETAVNNLRTDGEKQQATLRAEMKGDITEIKEMLNRILFGQVPVSATPNQRQQQQLNEWRK